MIANFVFGKRFATAATWSAMRKPTAITRSASYCRTAADRFGM